MTTIKVTIEIDVPDNATKEDISEWVDVQYGECNSMRPDNPCIDGYEVYSAEWENV
ncbi:hypothetical protein MC145_000746 [Salmonella enterica]|nr:hypothetical protein [Salmonella enterica]EJN4045238.1 hypothetical protein [Salmonella enterica]QVA90908.1 hypothetical protein JYM69_23195 [Salmonella enterica subsp. enterica serovar Sandiego]